MDVVYFVKEGAQNPELIYSVRSVCKNLKFRKIWFIGGCPEGIMPDFYCHFNRVSSVKTRNTAAMFRMLCGIDKISDNFIFFNDDFYVMKPTDKLPPRYWGTLGEKVELMEEMYGSTRWSRLLEQAEKKLKEYGYETYDFELHVPMIMNKERLAEVINKFPGTPCKRSLYGNYFRLYMDGEEKPDGKIHGLKHVVQNMDFLSTDDESFRRGAIGEQIRKAFPKPSDYEL